MTPPGAGGGGPAEGAGALVHLAEAVYAADDYAAIHRALTRAALRAVPGCTRAGMLIVVGGAHRVAGATDDVAEAVHRYEIALREGPCLDAEVTDAPQWTADLRAGSPWPALTERVLRETPVRSTAGFPIMGEDGAAKVGSLNLFSDTPGGLTARSVDHGVLVAAVATVALRAAAAQRDAATLRAGLATNREIGTAVGLLMGFHRVSSDRAFEILRALSQGLNRKVHVIAREIIEEHERTLGPGAADGPAQSGA